MTLNPHESTPAPRSKRRGRRRIAAVLGVVAAGAMVAIAFALFTSTATVSGQNVGTATIEIEAGTAAASSPIDIDDLLPGDTQSTTIDLENTGTAGVYLSVRLPLASGASGPLSEALRVTLTAGDASHELSLADWQLGAVHLSGALADDSARPITVTVELPLGAGSADGGATLQGQDLSFAVEVTAVQERHVTPQVGWVPNAG